MKAKQRLILPILRTASLFLICFAAIFALYAIAGGAVEYARGHISRDAVSDNLPESADGSTPVMFIATTENGKIVILNAKDRTVKKKLDVWITLLPESDRLYLADGIPIYSEREMNEIISYYTS